MDKPAKSFSLQENLFNCEHSRLETYFCKDCHLRTTLMTLLKQHYCTGQFNKDNITRHIQTYSCKQCNFGTHFALKWLKHLTDCSTKCRKNNLSNTQFQCDKSRLANENSYRTTQQDLNQRFKCEYCPFRTKQITSLTLHSRIKHKSANISIQHNVGPTTSENPQFECERCQFVTHQKRLLQQHLMYVHTPKKWHRCVKCTYKTRSLNNLNAHKKHHLKSESLQCDKCKTQHVTTKCLHETDIKWLHCDQCPSRFKEKTWLKYHIQFEHVKNVEFECEQCPYKTNRKSKLSKHVVARHKHENDIKWYKCEHCVFKSKEKQGLQRHVTRKHTSEEKIRWFKCDNCSYKTKENASLINHTIRMHLKEDEIQWFECEDCSYKAKMKDDLRKHKDLRHLDEEDLGRFKCNECGFRTKIKMYLNAHVKRRHGPKSEIR